MTTKRIPALAALVVLLAGCGMARDMIATQKKSETCATMLENEVGVKPAVGWSIVNGSLANVNVAFPLEGLEGLPVGDLDAKVRTVVARTFEKPPKQLVVSVVSRQ